MNQTMTQPTVDTPKGTHVAVDIHTGYVLHQHRPYECKTWLPDPDRKGHYATRCRCGKCDGITTQMTGTYEGTTYWAENSIEGQVLLDEPVDGRAYHTVHFAAPSGDRCY